MKHIHHHKKIYITNHPAASQYAPAYLPGVKGSVALPSNVRRPAVANYVPFNSVDLFEESRARLPGVAPAASKLLPLYRARGHYGPHHTEWDEQEYDLAPPPEPTDIYAPSAYSVAPATAVVSSKRPSNRVKILKLKEIPRKKVVRKIKPKRVILRGGRPQPKPQPQVDDEHPVTSFHEQFYSDLEEAGTIRKVKKPPRIEKIIDGDTEHIHTYSEEHIHKVVFDDDSKLTGVVGVDPVASMSSLNAGHPLIPLKNAQTLVAIPSESFSNLAVVGSMGTPSHLEYSAYNPREVTHDHIFHDHGELPRGVKVTEETLRLPPKISYNSQGLPIITHNYKRYPGKTRFYGKPTKPTPDMSYYENIYTHPRPKKVPRPTLPTPSFDVSSEANIDDYRPIPAFRFKEKRKSKTRHGTPNYGKQTSNYQLQQASVPAPFAVSSTVVHNYDQKYPGLSAAPTGFSKFRDHLADFKDSYTNEFDYDTFASSSNLFTSEDKNEPNQGIPGKKSVSTQNISFGGQDHQTFVDHLGASSNSEISISDGSPTAAENYSDNDEAADASPTPYTIKETSPAHQYYTVMALKALHGDQPEASNDNAQYVDAPTPTATIETPVATTTSHPQNFFNIHSTDAVTSEPDYGSDTRQGKRRKEKNKSNNGEKKPRYNSVFEELMSTVTGYKTGNRAAQAHGLLHPDNYYLHPNDDAAAVRGNPKYGDKI